MFDQRSLLASPEANTALPPIDHSRTLLSTSHCLIPPLSPPPGASPLATLEELDEGPEGELLIYRSGKVRDNRILVDKRAGSARVAPARGYSPHCYRRSGRVYMSSHSSAASRSSQTFSASASLLTPWKPGLRQTPSLEATPRLATKRLSTRRLPSLR